MTHGYLINAQRIITYTEWYLHNPLQQFFNFYNAPMECPFDDKESNTSKSYDRYDRQKAHNLIDQAKKHPYMLRFGKTIAKSLNNNNDFIDEEDVNQGDGFRLGFKSTVKLDKNINFEDGIHIISVPSYVIYLTRQTLLKPEQVLNQIKKINRQSKQYNRNVTRLNALCDKNIKQVNEYFIQNLQYKKFLGNHTIDKGILKNELKNSAFFYCDFENYKRAHRQLKVRANGTVYYKGQQLDNYGTVAYWAGLKRNCKKIISEDSIPTQFAFYKDLTYSNILNMVRDKDRHYISNPYSVFDYQNYIKPYHNNVLSTYPYSQR